MSSPAVQQEQLLELLLQLKKASPDEARAILNSQPQIAYALMTVMVNINAINVDAVQKTLSQALPAGGPSASAAMPQRGVPPSAPASTVQPATVASYSQAPQQIPQLQPSGQPPTAIPPHISGQQNRGGTPPYGYGSTPPYPRGGTPTYGRSTPVHTQPPMHPGQAAPYPYQAPPSQLPQQPPYIVPAQVQPPFNPPPQPQQPFPPALQDTLAAIPEDQKALIMRIIAMTPEDIQRLPPQERNNIMQLRQTLGLPS